MRHYPSLRDGVRLRNDKDKRRPNVVHNRYQCYLRFADHARIRRRQRHRVAYTQRWEDAMS